MSPTNLSPNRVPCACWRLARELDGVIDFMDARPKAELTFENMARLFVRTSAGLSEMPNALYFQLRRHRVFGESHLPTRTETDHECVRCRALPLDRNHFHAVSSPLSFDGAMALCRDCELELGTDLPSGWPRCDECARPFPTVTAGEAGFGQWVAPVAEGEPLCLVCALAQRYDDDHAKITTHCLDADTVLDQATTWLWSGAGLFELLRLGAVTLTEAASVIRRRAIQIGIESPARPPAETARRAIWREEQRTSA
jgi:hypothetical protein